MYVAWTSLTYSIQVDFGNLIVMVKRKVTFGRVGGKSHRENMGL